VEIVTSYEIIEDEQTEAAAFLAPAVIMGSASSFTACLCSAPSDASLNAVRASDQMDRGERPVTPRS
jgi:hypothetical protein